MRAACLPILIIAQLCAFRALAQQKPVNHSIRAGVDIMPIDGLTTPGTRYQARYARHLFNDRLLIGASVGYLRSLSREEIRDGIYVLGQLRRRTMSDISLLYEVLPSAKQALRIGGGLSFISRQDNVLRSLGYSVQDENVYRIRVERADYRGNFLGYHLMVEYERVLSPALAISGRIGWTDAKSDFPIALAGFGVSYLIH